ncbi:Bug family tripartite tricarboxylate transporter substrate binding protein [Xylophilus sp. ASV27]|uniref:Bug family tripartite tricarboxylate transporter substrate binding protein n=1 Tax=Xylophilus sp. ASV27 TaxID=2795129 RepID=UPI0018EE2C8E|nr:Bug family tripartite tricarboxylate transporter substrate binding protein [Xylophilus sp. ASV27]
MNTRRDALGALAAATALGPLSALTLRAQALEQVRIFYGFPPGSSGDSVARRVGEKLAGSAYTRNAAVVDNKPGAGGRIALESLKASPADGSALALAPVSALSIYPHIYGRLAYKAEDFAPVSIGAVMHHGLAVGPMVPANVRTVQDFIGWAKANPKDASYGSPGAGSLPHFLGALLGIETQTELKHVPYRGSIPGVTDAVGGQIAAMVTPSGDYLPHVKGGKLRVLATSGHQRSPFLPDVQTFAEQGLPGLTAEEWFGFYAPARTPAATLEAANAAINQALRERSVQDSLAVVGLIVQGSTPQAMAASQQSEYERWGPLVKKIGFSAES